MIDAASLDFVRETADGTIAPEPAHPLDVERMKRRAKMACLSWGFTPALDGGLILHAGDISENARPFFYCSPGVIDPDFMTLLCQHLHVYVYRGTNKIISPTPENLALLATHYADEINLIQPDGPIYLGGYCEAALLQWALAHELTRRGRRVALLALVDLPLAPRRGVRRVIYDAIVATRTSINSLFLLYNQPQYFRRRLVGRSRSLLSKIKRRPHDEHQIRSYKDWVLEPLPPRFQGQVLLVCGSRGVGAHLRFRWAQADWRRLTRDLLKITFVPGAHATLQWPKIADAICGHVPA